MQDTGPADLVEAVDFGDVRARRHRNPPFRFCHHSVAVAEGDRVGRAHLRAGRFEPDLYAVGAERAFVDFGAKFS